jgi:hypothetical protein
MPKTRINISIDQDLAQYVKLSKNMPGSKNKLRRRSSIYKLNQMKPKVPSKEAFF